MSGAFIEVQRASVHASLHALSQPLTVVSLALTLAQSSPSEAERAFALESAMTECQRAMESVRSLRALLDGNVEPKLPVVATAMATGTEGSWAFGGAA